MIQKFMKVSTCDQLGIGWLRVIHLYRGSFRRYSKIGEFIKMSIRTIYKFPKKIKGKRYRRMRIGFVVRGLVFLAFKNKKFFDFSRISIFSNSVILLKKKGVFKSKNYVGPSLRLLNKWNYIFLTDYYI